MAAYVESEIKLRVAGVAPVRAALQAMGAQLERLRHFEDNVILDDGARNLAAAGRLLRLRTTDAGAVVTFKGPRLADPDVKSREEIEVAVGDAAATEAIFAQLGFTPRFRYQKYRETWRWEDVEIVIDETPVGVFVEIEGIPSAIHTAAERMGYTRSDYLTESYATLFFASGGSGDMVFPA